MSLKHIFYTNNLDLMLTQETMCKGVHVVKKNSKLLHEWEMVVLDSSGPSSGLLATWNPLVMGHVHKYFWREDILVLIKFFPSLIVMVPTKRGKIFGTWWILLVY